MGGSAGTPHDIRRTSPLAGSPTGWGMRPGSRLNVEVDDHGEVLAAKLTRARHATFTRLSDPLISQFDQFAGA